jgi:hypothetical protein
VSSMGSVLEGFRAYLSSGGIGAAAAQ